MQIPVKSIQKKIEEKGKIHTRHDRRGQSGMPSLDVGKVLARYPVHLFLVRIRPSTTLVEGRTVEHGWVTDLVFFI